MSRLVGPSAMAYGSWGAPLTLVLVGGRRGLGRILVMSLCCWDCRVLNLPPQHTSKAASGGVRNWREELTSFSEPWDGTFWVPTFSYESWSPRGDDRSFLGVLLRHALRSPLFPTSISVRSRRVLGF